MTFKEKFDALKGKKKAKLVSFGLILLINTALLFVPLGLCFVAMLIPLAIFGIQYIFGERELKWFILLGLLIILITGLILGVISAYLYYNYQPPPVEGSATNDSILLTDGKVEPYSGGANQLFTFTVVFTDSSGERPSELKINIYSYLSSGNVTPDMKEADLNDNDTSDGKLYYYDTVLVEDIHYFRFLAENSSGITIETTGSYGIYEQGPINLPLGQFLLIGLSYAPFLAMIYLLFIMLYWWTQKAKTYQPRPPTEPKEEETEFTCSKCGADVPADATKCPKCGEEFEEDEEDKLKEKIEKGLVYCKVCMNTIKKGDMVLGCQCGRAFHLKCAQRVGKCPSCGTEFKE